MYNHSYLAALAIRKGQGNIAILTHQAGEQRVKGLQNADICDIRVLPVLYVGGSIGQLLMRLITQTDPVETGADRRALHRIGLLDFVNFIRAELWT
ncbi:MAG: hypothetical protein ACREQD_06865, partial [Candidatus Binataceae bacterium]